MDSSETSEYYDWETLFISNYLAENKVTNFTFKDK